MTKVFIIQLPKCPKPFRPPKSGLCGLQVPETFSVQAPGLWHILFSLFRALYSRCPPNSLHHSLSFMSCLCSNFPYSGRPLQPHCLKSFDHSHSYLITPYPFLCFYFSIALIFFLHVMYFTCLSYSFSLSHTPTPVSLEYKFSGEQRFVGLYFLQL